MARFKPLTYEQWRDHMLATMPADELVDCPECDGEQVRECCECGHERECRECEDGKVPFAELNASQQQAHFHRGRYEAAVLADAIAWGNWCSTEPAEALTAAGFLVATRVSSRQLEIVGRGQGQPRWRGPGTPYGELAARFATSTYQQATLQ